MVDLPTIAASSAALATSDHRDESARLYLQSSCGVM
jgi:hypothetical protein